MSDHTKRRVVPWKNRNEFECVYNEIFGDNSQLQTHAVGRIDVWRSRALHKIPVAIDSTAAIVHAKLYHQKAVQSKQDRQQDNEIRSSYSLALIRFVNHITEKRQIGEYAQPVHVLASKVGVPEWIVELRHDATHRHLPPLPMLVSACDWALSWLKNEFWKKQLSSMAQKVERKNTENSADKFDVKGLLENYEQQKFQKTNKDNSWKIVKDLEKFPIENRQELVACLVEDGFMIPTREQLQALRIPPSKLDKPGYTLPHMIISFWKPVLQFLHQVNLTNSLLIKLTSEISTESCRRNYTMCRWINTIVTANGQAGAKNLSQTPTRLYQQSVSLTFRPLLRSLLNNLCGHTIPLIKRLLDLGKEKGEYSQTQVTMLNTLINKLKPSSPKGQSLFIGEGESDDLDQTVFTREGETEDLEAVYSGDGESDDLDQTLSTGQGESDNLEQTLPLVQDGTDMVSPGGQGGTNTQEDRDKAIYRVQDLKSRKRKLEASEDDIPVKVASRNVCAHLNWQFYEDEVDWSQIPIGILPGQSLDYLTLDLSTNIEESFSNDISMTVDEDFDDNEESSGEEDTNKEITCSEETCHPDKGTVPSSTWTSQQMAKIKRGVRLL
ncbi:ribosomal biogenesis protein LAS1L-like [Pecten maximus]|uniref:ribosomal biogenesis protein LAS1L-like n=1 Tax=Pecten maximus TaxID=6579 RepID=UPI001459074E|nr:ribosomal biogenesis protein LAS1L-like [Pecten maximus]